LTNNAGISRYASVAASGNNVYVAWHDDTFSTGVPEIFFKRSINSGVSWEASQRLTNNAGDSWHPSVAVSGYNVYVAWDDDTFGNTEIFFKRSTDNGVSWEATQRLTNNAGDSAHPSVAAISSNVYVAWHDLTFGNYEIFFKCSINFGVSWEATQRLTNNAGTSWIPSVAVSGYNVYVAWEDSTFGNYEIFFKKGTFYP